MPCNVLKDEQKHRKQEVEDGSLAVKVPEKGLTINGLIAGLKDEIPQIHEALLTNPMMAIEERVIDDQGSSGSESGI